MINQCNFIGRLGRDPETRYTQSGKAVASFSIACSEKRGGEESTEWVNIVAWEKLAEICGQYLVKGSLVYISGRMQTRKWQDQNGNDRYTTEVVAREMKMLDSRGGGDRSGSAGADGSAPPMDDSVPF
jgi:single-strand DNA-binding protein